MALSKREISFYIYVTGFSIFGLTLILFIWLSMYPFVNGTLSEEQIVGSALLIPVSHMISSAILLLAHKMYTYFNLKIVLAATTLAYPVCIAIASLVR